MSSQTTEPEIKLPTQEETQKAFQRSKGVVDTLTGLGRKITEVENVVIMGAAGRDFHDFNVYWTKLPHVNVVCFTAAAQLSIDLAKRIYPPELCPPGYPNGIPIFPESELESIIQQHKVTTCALAYSDLSFADVMAIGSRVNAAGANFVMVAPQRTMLEARKPVVAVVAVRTGCGKSQTTRYIARLLRDAGKKVVVVRHPMPYGVLKDQKCERFAKMDDMRRFKCTIEEMEEYELHIEEGNILYAGCDYQTILREAEKEADIVIWDGGNNDTSFFKPNLTICVTDALRPGHEMRYYPGETNTRICDIAVINKVDSAEQDKVEEISRNLKALNPRASITTADSAIEACMDNMSSGEALKWLKGKKSLVIDDGPTLTHGGMSFGAGFQLAQRANATVIDPKPFAKGAIKDAFNRWSHLKLAIPALGYSPNQVADLEATIAAAAGEIDVVVVGTPINLQHLIKIPSQVRVCRARYSLSPKDGMLAAAVDGLLRTSDKHKA